MANIAETDDLWDLLEEVCSAEPKSPRQAAIEEVLRKIQAEQRWVSKSPDYGRTKRKRSRSVSLTRIDAAEAKKRAAIMKGATLGREEELNKIGQVPNISTTHLHGRHENVLDPRIHENVVLLQQHCDSKLELITQGGSEEFYVGMCCSPYIRHDGSHTKDMPYRGHKETWEEMHLLCASTGGGASVLEKGILNKSNKWKLFHTCKNKGPGGERPGPQNEISFVYVVTGRRPER